MRKIVSMIFYNSIPYLMEYISLYISLLLKSKESRTVTLDIKITTGIITLLN